MKYIKLMFWATVGLALGACDTSENDRAEIQELSWEELKQEAAGTEVEMMMWTGDPLINRYMKNYVQPKLKERYNIRLEIAGGQGTQIVSLLMNEKQARKSASEIDMMWINGETFYQLRQIDALYGPFLEKLPNSKYLNLENKFISRDFQQPIEGMEAPWGNVQMTVIYNSQEVPSPPADLQELGTFLKKHPGKFTIPTEFTGMTLLKSWLMALAGAENLQGDFDEGKYQRYSDSLFNWINRHRSYFWKKGETFPESLSQMHQMFANGELYFTFSNNDTEVDNKIAQGIFPKWARAYVYRSGTIQNSHYLGVSKKSPNKAGALVTINFLMSPEAQLHKFNPEIWGDGTVLAMEKLPSQWRTEFEKVKARQFAPSRDSLNPYALPELAPEYMVRLYEDFRKRVIEEDA